MVFVAHFKAAELKQTLHSDNREEITLMNEDINYRTHLQLVTSLQTLANYCTLALTFMQTQNARNHIFEAWRI